MTEQQLAGHSQQGPASATPHVEISPVSQTPAEVTQGVSNPNILSRFTQLWPGKKEHGASRLGIAQVQEHSLGSIIADSDNVEADVVLTKDSVSPVFDRKHDQGRRMNRRSFLGFTGGSLASSAFLAACGSGGEPLPEDGNNAQATSTPDSSPTAVATKEPMRRTPDALSELGVKAGLTGVGAAVSDKGLSSIEYTKLLYREFDTVVPTNDFKWKTIRPSRAQFNFGKADSNIKAINERDKGNMKVKGTPLLWGWREKNPTWVIEANPSRDESIAILKEHIRETMTHFGGTVKEWDVVNEARLVKAAPGVNGPQDDIWAERIGSDYIDIAFQTADEIRKELNLDVALTYNQYSPHVAKTADAITNQDYEVVKRLKGKGLVDVYGFQMHLIEASLREPNWKMNLDQRMKKMASLGVKVSVTELTYGLANGQPLTTQEQLETQADVFATVAQCLLECGNPGSLTVWELTDKFQESQWATSGVFGSSFEPKLIKAALDNTFKAHIANLAKSNPR